MNRGVETLNVGLAKLRSHELGTELGIPQPVPSSNSPGKPQVVDKKHVCDSYELRSQGWS